MAVWTLDIYDRVGSTPIKTGVDFDALTARWVLNAPGSIEIDVKLTTDIGSAVIGQAEFQLKRAGTTVWAGPWLGTSIQDPKLHRAKLNGEGLWSWMRSRLVTSNLYYTAITQHAIAWNLIAHTQGQTNGALGFVDGSNTGSNPTRTRYYCGAQSRPNVGDEVEALTELDTGFDFVIDPATRAFNTWSPQRKAASGIALDGTKVDTIQVVQDIRDMENYVTGIGSDDCGPIVVDVSDGTLGASYGRRHGVVEPDLSVSSEVTAVANEELRAHKRPRFDATVTYRENGTNAPAWGAINVGDTLTLQDDRGLATYGPSTLRCLEMAVSLDNGLPNQPVIELVLSSAVD